MLSTLVGLPVILIALVLQMGIFSRLPLLNGTADLLLLVIVAWALQARVTSAWHWALMAGVMVSLISAMPFFLPLVLYLMVTALARALQGQVWQIPVLAMFVATIAGTLIYHLVSILILQLAGTPLDWQESLSLVTLPSVLLNLLLALPIFALVSDLAKLIHPVKAEE